MFLWFKKYTVTEENFEEILAKLIKLSHKFKFLRTYRTRRIVDDTIYHQSNPVRIHQKIVRNPKTGEYKKRHTLSINSMFLEIEKHRFRIEYEKSISGDNSASKFMVKYYDDMKSLIWIGMDPSSALVLDTGSKITFFPFGFKIDDDGDAHIPRECYYTDTFVANIFSKPNIDAEIASRRKQEEEDAIAYASEIEDRFEDTDSYEDDHDWEWD